MAAWENGGDYTPFGVSQNVSAITLDETHYAAPPMHLAVLHRFAAETDIYEHRNLHANIPFIPTGILAALAVASGSIERAFILSDVLFPALMLLLFYLLSEGLVESRVCRMFLAWSTLAIPFAPQDFTWLAYDSQLNPPIVTRTPQPEISLVFLLLSVLLLARSLAAPSRRLYALAAGFSAGLLIYCYYFYFVGCAAALGLLFVLAMGWRNWPLARSVFAAGAGAVFAAVPYLVVFVQARGEGGQAYILERMARHTRHFYAAPFVQGAILLALIFVYGRRAAFKNPAHLRYLLTAVLVAAGLLVANIHVVTGLDVQNAHFLSRLATPFLFFLAGVTLFHYLERFLGRKWPKLALRAAFAALIASLAAHQYLVASNVAAWQRSSSPEMQLVLWLRAHVPPERVVGTLSPGLIDLIPALTADYSYVPAGNRSLTATSEIVERYYELACAAGLSEADVGHIASRPGKLHPSDLLLTFGLRPERLAGFVNGYGTFLAGPQPALRYRIDYLVLPAEAAIPAPIAARYPHASPVYRNAGYRLLQLQ